MGKLKYNFFFTVTINQSNLKKTKFSCVFIFPTNTIKNRTRNQKNITRLVKRTFSQSCFFYKCFNDAEKNHWFIELKITNVVWFIKKIKYMVDSTKLPPTIIYIDHFVTVFIFRQTKLNFNSIDKFNLKFVKASQYLSTFNIEFRHKIGKSNIMPDVSSRLPAETKTNTVDKNGIFDVLYRSPNINQQFFLPIFSLVPAVWHMTLIEMSDDFTQCF